MKKYIVIAICILTMMLSGCNMNKSGDKNANVGDKVESEGESINNSEAMKFVRATNKSLTVTIVNDSPAVWQSGNMKDYELQVMKDGEWYKVEQTGEFANTMELIGLRPGEQKTHTFEFEDRYGILPSGKYRVVKRWWANATATTEKGEVVTVCEFDV